MIEQLKFTLEQIRKARAEELSKNVPGYMSDEERKREQALLTLELPFSTDLRHVLAARGNAYNESVRVGQKKRRLTAYKLIQQWIKSRSHEEIEIRTSFCQFLHERHVLCYYKDLGYKAKTIKAEELSRLVSIDTILSAVNSSSSLSEDLRGRYRNLAEDLSTFIHKDLYAHAPIPKRPPLSLFDAEKFFEYLECRALKSTTTRAYTDILLCRSLFYAPLPAKKLFALGSPKRKKDRWWILSDTASFPVPNSFVTLWKILTPGDLLLPRAFDEDQLSKKVHRLGKYAELSTTLNPSILRHSRTAIPNELGIDSLVVDTLPPR